MILTLEQKAFLAKLAYEPDTDIITEQLGIMFDVNSMNIEYIYVERTDTEGFIFRLEDTCIISFSGTESLKDLWHDLIFIPSKYCDGYLHTGFKKIFELINCQICTAVKNLFPKDPVKKIIAIGHSLGASIAMSACDVLYFSGYEHVETQIITFGCPNGWSKGAKKSFNIRHPDTTNYINPCDYVTWLLKITTSRPGKDIKLSGKRGHMMDKYQANIKYFSCKNALLKLV